MRTRQAVKFLLRAAILAGTIGGFSTYGLAEDIDLGKTEYEAACAACHGRTGKGDGPVSEELRTKPPDLTFISGRNGGVFPADFLHRVIDGRKTLRAHGTYEMPVWGPAFLRSGSEDAVRGRILAIIAYLRSIQLK
jgi:mono/diheme cytochrome c family protein